MDFCNPSFLFVRKQIKIKWENMIARDDRLFAMCYIVLQITKLISNNKNNIPVTGTTF